MSKRKSHVSREISRFSKLRRNDVVVTTFDEKVQLFKKKFPLSLDIDINEINNVTYANSLNLTKSID